MVIDLIGVPEKVVDLGGGGGGWVKAFREHGTQSVLCIDHPAVTQSDLLISPDEFLPIDLRRSIPLPIPCSASLCIEVAEHLPLRRSSDIVEFLTESADVVLFSAAVPNQGGLKHINEQRSAFWRDHFAEREFERFDALRPRIIHDKLVPWWLRQNLMLYARRDSRLWSRLSNAQRYDFPDDMELVSTAILSGASTGLRGALRSLPRLAARGFAAHVLRRHTDHG